MNGRGLLYIAGFAVFRDAGLLWSMITNELKEVVPVVIAIAGT